MHFIGIWKSYIWMVLHSLNSCYKSSLSLCHIVASSTNNFVIFFLKLVSIHHHLLLYFPFLLVVLFHSQLCSVRIKNFMFGGLLFNTKLVVHTSLSILGCGG